MTTDVLNRLTAMIGRREASCGTTKVIAVDGRSGSGKSRLADALVDRTGAALLRLEDVYPGWHGLEATPPKIAREVLAPIAAGDVGSVRLWDWRRDRPGAVIDCPPVPLLIIDGVGSGAAAMRPYLSLLIWIDAPAATRRRRALARDGEVYEPWWDVWAYQERRHFGNEQTSEFADVRLDASG